MLHLRTFRKIYLDLQEKDKQSMAVYSMYEHMPISFEYYLQEISLESEPTVKNRMIELYNKMCQEKNIALIQGFMRKDFLNLELIFGHLTAFVFQKEPFEVAHQIDTYISQMRNRLDKNTLESGAAEAIMKEIHHKITQSFILDNSFLGHYDITEVRQQHIISQYTLSILILIVAERLHLPIFGLPFTDKLVLCYAQNYCTHSELVGEEDILYYLVLGQKDLIYTLDDLKLLAVLEDETLELKSILPSSNRKITESWLEHLSQNGFDAKTKHNLSSIYQQIFSLTEEF